jgi:hypothetical protein
MVPGGWDNQLWRLGDDLAVRLAWTNKDAGEPPLQEHAFLPAWRRASLCRFRLRNVRTSLPSGYHARGLSPPGSLASPPTAPPATRGGEAADALAAFLTALHQSAPDDAPAGATEVARWPSPARASRVS